MFVITLNKKKIKKIAAVALCVVAVGAVGIRVRNHLLRSSETFLASRKTELSTTQQMVDYIAQKGFEVDIRTAQVAEVEIPKKFDDNFVGFNEKIKQTDNLSLDRYKGDKVNKWTFDIVDYPNGDMKASAVLLMKKEKLVGAYILEHPEGIAKAMLVTAQNDTQQ